MAMGGEKGEEGGEEIKYVTSEELGRHNRADDLWISIQGKVYDVTTWVPHHPGGELPLLSLAGQDVTDAFVAYHPGSAWRHLDCFLVARLSDYSVSPISRDYRAMVARISSLGLFDRVGATPALTLLAILLLFLLSLSLALLLSLPLLSGALMGLMWIQSGWLGHDSGHHPISRHPTLNRLAQIASGNCLAGISIGWWKRNHNAHHISCNSLDFDPDLQHMPFFAVSPKFFSSAAIFSRFYGRPINFDPLARLLVSHQHLTFYPVMCFARLNLFAQSLLLLLSPSVPVTHRAQEILGVLVFWIWYPALVSAFPTWPDRSAFVLASFAVTGIQHVQFCLNHFSSSVYVGNPTANNWFQKQTMGTLDISCAPWMDWFHGGLQFQVEHHLFPRLPRCHYRSIAPLVRDLCKKHNLPYNCASFLQANALTISTLRAAALQARNAGGPVPKNLVWEALNTHG